MLNYKELLDQVMSESGYMFLIIYSVIIGVLLSCFTGSLALVLFVSVLLEVVYYCMNPSGYKYYMQIPLILFYLFGWLLGRTIFEQGYYYISDEFC